MIAFSFLKSIQIFYLPFFLGTITMGDNHVALFIDLMNPTVNKLFVFCLTIVT